MSVMRQEAIVKEEAAAFCPAHITGFFKSHLDGTDGDGYRAPESMGSTGAGFSIRHGVTARVRVKGRGSECGVDGGNSGGVNADSDNNGSHNNNDSSTPRFTVTTNGYQTDGRTDITEAVLGRFVQISGRHDASFEIWYDITVPIGYGLGVSGAVALSLALALDKALHTGLSRNEIGSIAHNAEVGCRTGLGDVLASFHGGFEIRTRPGAPGIGMVQKIQTGGRPCAVAVACIAPVPTDKFIRERLHRINGVGGRMVKRLLQTKSCKHFQEMSLSFARHAGVITPRMQGLIDALSRNGIGCGVALFGETVFVMMPDGGGDGDGDGDGHRHKVLRILRQHSPGGTVIESVLDDAGARMLADYDDKDDGSHVNDDYNSNDGSYDKGQTTGQAAVAVLQQ